MRKRTFRVMHEWVVVNRHLFLMGQPRDKPSLLVCSEPLNFVHKIGYTVVLWPAEIHAANQFYVDVCGCIYSDPELRNLLHIGVIHEVDAQKALPRPHK